MPNIGTVLKEEIVRLSRKEVRSQIDPTKKTTTQLRHDVAALKRQVAQLERQIAMLSRKVLGAGPTEGGEGGKGGAWLNVTAFATFSGFHWPGAKTVGRKSKGPESTLRGCKGRCGGRARA